MSLVWILSLKGRCVVETGDLSDTQVLFIHLNKFLTFFMNIQFREVFIYLAHFLSIFNSFCLSWILKTCSILSDLMTFSSMFYMLSKTWYRNCCKSQHGHGPLHIIGWGGGGHRTRAPCKQPLSHTSFPLAFQTNGQH